MWIYLCTEPDMWAVDFYSLDGRWHPDSDFATQEAVAERVHYLNGGNGIHRPTNLTMDDDVPF